MEIERVLITEAEIKRRVSELGAKITEDYRDKDLLVVGVLKGAVVFLADLIRSIQLPLELDFISLSSYGKATQNSGVVRVLRDLDQEIGGRDVLVVEDIVDSGLTLSYLRDSLLVRKPASLKLCAFLDKPSRRRVDLEPDYCGIAIEDHFVVGYGLDYREQYRALPYIAVVRP